MPTPKTKQPKARKRTLKQERWLKDYLATGNSTTAVRTAGYRIGNLGGRPNSSSTISEIGRQNLKKLGREVEEAREMEGLSWLTPEYILTSLNKIATDANAPYRSKISALELLGKSLALFTDKVETQQKILGIIGEITTDWRELEGEKQPDERQKS